MRNSNFLILGLFVLAACGDSKGGSDSDTASSSGGVVTTGEPTGTGSTTGTGTGDDTTATTDPGATTTTGDPTSEATQTDSAPTTVTTEIVTTDAETDSTASASSTGDTDGTGDTDTGVVPDGFATVENTCAPNDGPAVEFKLDVNEPVCGAGWDGDQLRILVFQGAPLPADTYMLGDDVGFASLQIGNDEPLNAVEGSLTIESWDNVGVSGSYELTFTDNSIRSGAFSGPFCQTMPMCG